MLKAERDEIIGVREGPAKNAARKLLKLASVKNAPVYINQVVPVLKEQYGLDDLKGLELSEHLSGFLIQESDLSAIAYNKDHHVHRKRFTVAHEIGHLVLGHNTCDEGGITENEETEANIFAAEMLMPAELLKKDLNGSGFTLDSLAKNYWVSSEAMGNRLRDPHILKLV